MLVLLLHENQVDRVVFEQILALFGFDAAVEFANSKNKILSIVAP